MMEERLAICEKIRANNEEQANIEEQANNVEKPADIGEKQADIGEKLVNTGETLVNNERKCPNNKPVCTCPKEEKHPHFRPEVQPLAKEKVPDEQVTVERTSDFYRIDNIPGRFEFPSSFQGYGTPQQQNPMYRTTSAEYGAKPPTVHTVPVSFHPRPQKFTNHLGPCGMYRNRSLNTALDKSII